LSYERLLHETALVVALLWPRVREEKIHRVDGAVAELAHDIYGNARDHADVREIRLLEEQQQMSDAGLVHLDTQIIDVAVVRSAGHDGLAVAETDVEHSRRTSAEQRVEVERRAGVGRNAEAWQ